MRRAPAAAASLVLIALGGCGGPSGESDRSRAESLWSARVAYVGDNSRVTALIDAIGLAGAGGYEVELSTAEAPHSMAISLEDLDQPFDAADVCDQAILLLGLIENLDEVSITADQDGCSSSAASASRDLGHDVKQLGRDRSSLVRHLELASD